MKVGIVLVTFNRIKDLQKTLLAYEKQIVAPEFVLVVDNNSTDGTKEYLKEWKNTHSDFKHYVLSLPQNIGGSGGFYMGMKEALKLECDWIFVADDDAVPDSSMLKELIDFKNRHKEKMEHVSALCTSVNNRGKCAGIHRCRIKRSFLGCFESYVPEEEYTKEYFEIDIYSFVGTMIRRDALEKAGLARKEFFIYNDDYEHAIRIGKTGQIICVPKSIMYHVDNLNYSREATWRDYYATRNGVIMHLEHFGIYAGIMRALRRLAVGIAAFNFPKIKVICIGIKDGFMRKTGIHHNYKPGWKVGK